MRLKKITRVGVIQAISWLLIGALYRAASAKNIPVESGRKCTFSSGNSFLTEVAHNSVRILALGVVILLLGYSPISQASLNGIINTYGGPASGGTCTGCHNANTYTITTTVSAPTSVAHGSTSSPIQISSTAAGVRRGFNAAIHDPFGALIVGSFPGLSTGVTVSSGQITHTSPRTETSWDFTWSAPDVLGTYTVYACVNPVNNTGDSSGDGNADCKSDTITVFNTPPNANNNLLAITVNEDDTAYSGSVDMLLNDTQTQGDAFSWFSHSVGSVVGDLDRVTGGTYRYRPAGQFESLDSGGSATTSFTYTIRENAYTGLTDCQGSPCRDTATVSIQVNGANDAPVANPDTITVDIAGTATTLVGGASSVLANDTDPDSGEAVKQAFLVSGPSNHDTAMAGPFALNTDGSFSYTHDGSGAASDSFTYRVWDGTAFSANGTVTITVSNTAPTAVDDLPMGMPVANVMEGGSINFTVLGNDTDPETSAIAVVNVSNVIGGMVTVEANQSITFDHDGSETAPASFEYQASDGFLDSLGSAIVTISVTPVNDPPVIGTVTDFTSEEGVLISFNPGVTDPDDPNDGTEIFWDFVSGKPPDMTISNIGLIEWTPPLGPPAVFNQTYPIVISADDGDAVDTESFTITINPPDFDGDLVADYDDLCVTVPSVNPGENFDNDNDGVPNTDGGANSGGDVCDLDDDNDGMSDADELTWFFDPFDPSDANEDADGDGLTNLFEITNGSNPRFGNLVINATGYLTPFKVPAPNPTSVHPQASSVSTTNTGPYRPGRNTITWTGANSSNPNLGISNQILDVRPLVNFSANQQVAEGGPVTVQVTLNGEAPSYPVRLDYSISGTATAGGVDYTAPTPASGALQFNSTAPQNITFNTIGGDGVDPNETVVFTLTGATNPITGATNAALGSKRTHRVTIVEANVAPRATIEFNQGGPNLARAFDGDNAGNVNIFANATDLNTGQVLSYDWSGSDNRLTPPGDTPAWNNVAVTAGNYLIDVIVTDNGSPPLSTRVSRILNIASGTAPALTAIDTDGDGVNDDNPAEGHADDDGDGIPNYLDAVNDANYVPNQTANMTNSYLLQTDPGLGLARGNTAQAASRFGASLTATEIASFGSPTGTPPVNPSDSFRHVSGLFDFAVRGVEAGSSARIVIPLQSAIPKNAQYRKFNPAIGWGGFVVDNNNSVASAPGALGACPEPGSSAYRSGLNYLDKCIQLTIQDGGPNDTDNRVNGIVTDPGAVGVRLTDPEIEEVEEGGGRLSPYLLMLLLSLGIVRAWRRHRESPQI